MPRTFSDQPGRYIAVFLVSPLLVIGGVMLMRSPEAFRSVVSIGIIIFGVILFLYDGYWLLARPPETAIHD